MWDDGRMDKWVARQLGSAPGWQRQVRRHHDGLLRGITHRDHTGDVDLYWALADNVTLCDNYLPQVSWVLGSLVDTEHAPAPVEWGQDDAQKVVLALLHSPQWPNTVLFITYDENGGFFDHVPPPVPSATDPAERPGEFFNLHRLGPTARSEGAGFLRKPIGLGFRVPALVISPFTRNPNPGGGPMVCSDTFDHTSLLRFVEAVFKVPVPRRDSATKNSRPEPVA